MFSHLMRELPPNLCAQFGIAIAHHFVVVISDHTSTFVGNETFLSTKTSDEFFLNCSVRPLDTWVFNLFFQSQPLLENLTTQRIILD